jgi:Fe-S-cluster-containing hydrogenase component 2
VTVASSPLDALARGQWVKLICGASYQHLPAIRSLALCYGLAGVDCIDLAADPAVVAAAQAGIAAAQRLQPNLELPWLMVSLNDGEDPHFRKAWFDPQRCPADCPRPCERVCPSGAITFASGPRRSPQGVLADRCYGCGRCLPVCPLGLIEVQAQASSAQDLMPQLLALGVQAIEIHTQPGRFAAFQALWQQISAWGDRLSLLAISCPDGPEHLSYLDQLYRLVAPHVKTLLWQTDGRPMSGDIGAGTTHACIQLGQRVLEFGPPGYVQLAGGTNAYTVEKLRQLQLLHPSQRAIAGIAFGSCARHLVGDLLDALEQRGGLLEQHADLLQRAVKRAGTLVQPLKAAAHLI